MQQNTTDTAEKLIPRNRLLSKQKLNTCAISFGVRRGLDLEKYKETICEDWKKMMKTIFQSWEGGNTCNIVAKQLSKMLYIVTWKIKNVPNKILYLVK